jgi:hypothetical protein
MTVKFLQSRLGKTIKWLGIGLVSLLLLAILLFDVFKVGSVALPPAIDVKVSTLEQGWNPGWEVGQSQWFHHAEQGTKVLHYDWFMALEQPEITVLTTPGKFSDPAYLQRFGFIPSSEDKDMNPDGLPVGFAINRSFQEPQADAPPPYPVVGLTCAACHTGQINYKGKSLRIDGGSGMVDLGKFKTALGLAVFYTKVIPGRFDRFARSALGDRYSADSKAKLQEELDEFIAKGREEKAFADSKGLYAREGGFARTDALGLILNRVFDQINNENANVADAPVNFPHIWDSSWFEWVQYNASIRTPMARNIGEVLGVGGMINLPGMPGDNWKSTVNVSNLHRMEKQLSGDEPYGGLRSPKWPAEVLGPLNADLVKKGAELYVAKRCINCHWRVEDIKAAMANEDGQGGPNLTQMWTSKNLYGKRFINTAETVINVELIGTDPGAAINFARRVVVLVNGRELSVAGGNLDYVTNRVRQVEYYKLGLLDEFGRPIEAEKDRKLAYDAYRLPWDEFVLEKVTATAPAGEPDERTMGMIEAELNNQRDAAVRLGYKARPLNGIWATAPYLHNASVRNLYQLLSPVKERDVRFNLGSKEFDPVNVGYVNEKLTGGFVMDTTLPGNLNAGHEFRDPDPDSGATSSAWVKGVLGKALTHDERMALIEYLKSL